MLNEALSKMPEVFDSGVLLRGQEYFLKGQVLNIRLSDGLLKGRVKGSSNRIYDIHMDLKRWPNQAARCTCPYQSNCKHAAACLFALRDKEQKSSMDATNTKLDRRLDTWLKNLRAQEASSVKQPEATHHLLYNIEIVTIGNEDRITILLVLAKILKRGGYGKKTPLSTLSDSKKQHFIDDDNDIVAQLLYKCGYHYGYIGAFHIRNSDLFEKILATGRAFLEEENDAIRLGETLDAAFEWVLPPDGQQYLALMHNKQRVNPLLLDQSWYFDEDAQTIGRLETAYSVKQLGYLMAAPAIPLDQVELLTQKMLQICPELPAPHTFTEKEVRELEPIPCVTFATAYEAGLYDIEEQIFTAHVGFKYGNVAIAAFEDSESVFCAEDNHLIEYKRQKTFEQARVTQLSELIVLRSPNISEKAYCNIHAADYVLPKIESQVDLDMLCATTTSRLKELGWDVAFISLDYQQVLQSEDVEWFSDVEEQTTDFFSYQLGILVEGNPVSIVPLVASLIQNHSLDEIENTADDELVKLPIRAGLALQLPMGRIKPLIRLLLQFGLKKSGEEEQLLVSKFQLILMQEAELAVAATQARWRGAEQLRQALHQLTQLTALPEVSPPTGLKAQLRDYQHHGLNWLQFLRAHRLAGVLADDMGLGKTIQTLAHLQQEKEQGRLEAACLIIAPTSLVGNWAAEAKKFTPELSVLIYHGADRHDDAFDDYDVIVSTYGLIQRDKEKFVNYHFYYLILDEAQFIKNARTKTTLIIQQLKAQHRLCLTGTPLENHLGELWSLFHFLMPGLLGDSGQFRKWFRTPIEKNNEVERRELLAKRVKPFMLRRTKNQVANELPPKTEILRTIELEGAQRDLYEAIRMSMEKKVRDAIAKQGLGKSHILLLDALLKLRQVCCDPRLLSLSEATIAHNHSAKLDELMQLLEGLIEEGRRILIFSQFTSMLKLIEARLDEKKYDYLKLTGQTKNRQALVDKFQEGNTPLFLISLKAGGTGLNLTKADTVIHYDPWWNPAVEDQATDRTHRIGQNNPVFVYKLITAGTVEEVILGMQERKRQLANGILSADASQTVSLSEEDLKQLFLPL